MIDLNEELASGRWKDLLAAASDLATFGERVPIDERIDAFADVHSAALAMSRDGVGAAHLEGTRPSSFDFIDLTLPAHDANAITANPRRGDKLSGFWNSEGSERHGNFG